MYCPKCNKKINYFLAYTINDTRLFSYDGKEFKYKLSPINFNDMLFICPKCEEIISKNKQGIDYFIKKQYLKGGNKYVKK
jgi:hypothetical protein